MKSLPLIKYSAVLFRLLLAMLAAILFACSPGGDDRHETSSTLIDLGSADATLSASGGVQAERLETEMGSFRDNYAVRTIPRKGEEITFDVPFAPGTRSLILEFQEIHNRRPDAFGYTVMVNGEDVYFRTYQELGAGPNHFFVEVPSKFLDVSSPLKVTLRHEGGGAFSIGKVWVYEDFFEKVASAEGVLRPMGFMKSPDRIVEQEKDAGPKKRGPAADLQMFGKLRELYSGFKDYAPVGVLQFAGGYGHVEPVKGREDLRAKINTAAEVGVPGLWLINGTGWGGKPTGADGLGGYFSDIQYTYTDHDPRTGEYRASWPNMWANTPGAALRDPVMNDFLEKRFQQMLEGLPEQLAMLRLEGQPSSSMIIREFAPASGEISQAVIDSSARDGVKLDPVDGLSFEERLWLHRDAVNTWQEFSDSTVRAVGRDIVIVDQGKVLSPEEQLFDNLFAHPDFLTDKPMNDPRWGGGQHGMAEGGLWSSGEMGEGVNFRDIAMYDYLRARGKLAMINMERTILKDDFSVMKRHYERGFQFLCFFNSDPGDEKLIKKVDGISGDPVDPAVHRQPSLLDVLVRRDFNAGPEDKVSAIRNVKVHGSLRLAVEDAGIPGELVYRLTNSGDPFSAGLALDVDGRISPGEGNRIEIFVGPSPDDMSKVATLTEKELPDPDHWTPYMTSQHLVNLGNSMIGQKEAFLKLVFHADPVPDATFLLSLNVQTQWPRTSGYVTKPSLTKGQHRALQLWVQDRAMSDRLLKKYRELGGEDDFYREANDLHQRGWYRSAYQLLVSKISEVLPATYLVRGHGRLGRHPVSLQLASPEDRVFVTLEKAGPAEIIFSLDAVAGSQSGTVTLENVDPGKKWTLRSLGGGRYAATTAADGERPADGRVVLALDHKNPVASANKLPSTLVARCLDLRKDRITVDTQDLALMNYASNMMLPLAKDVVSARRPAALVDAAEAAKGDLPQKYDEVTLSINEQGQVSRMDARYGYDKGRIKNFDPPSVIGRPSNGVIELENGRRYGLMFDKTMTLFDTVALQGSLVAYEIRALKDALKPGHDIVVRYTPVASKDNVPRALSVTQSRKLLLEVDYTKDTDGSWKHAAHAVEGVEVKPHKPEPNYLYRVVMPLLRPVEFFKPGSVVYHVKSQEPLGTTVVELAARAFEDSSRVTVYTSPDGKKWTRCGQFDNTWQNNISQTLDNIPYQFIDVTSTVEGLKSFYLKLELAVNSADHRFCLAKVRVATEKKNP